MAVQHRARKILDRFKAMKADKANWLNLYQDCAEYVMSRKQGFTGDQPQGQIQTDHIFDDTAPKANSLMAASIIGALWPNGAKSFRIGMPMGLEEELGGETEEVKRYYQFVTQRMAEFMDNPKAGFITALEEYMLDQGAFGISGISIEDNLDDYEVPLSYQAVDAKQLHIAEGKNGFVNTIYIHKEFTIRQLIEEYGWDGIAKKWRDAYQADGDCKTKVKVLQAIEPRLEFDPYGFGVKNMPFASIHIDMDTEKIMRESGFHELPVAVARFWKAMGEVYGRSPAMQALPSIREANATGEAWILAMEKTLDPPLLVMDDGSLGGGIIDTGPGAIVVAAVSGRIGNQRPIEPLFIVGDLQWTAVRRKELEEIIKDHFFIDRLLDMNNEERMQNPEVYIRNQMRGQTLNTTYSRQQGELFVPVIETTFNKLFRRGLLGVIPGSEQELELVQRGVIPRYIPEAIVRRMATGQEVYKIEFISPASRIMQSEELTGIQNMLALTAQMAQVNPEALDILDLDWTLRRVQELEGAPRETIRSTEMIQKMRQQRAEMQQAMLQQEQMRQTSETARNMGQAVSSVSNQGKAA